jgi:hypothetical protein
LFAHLLEPDCIRAGLVAGQSRRRELPVRAFARGGIGDGRDVGGDLGGLTVDWRWAEHDRQATIEAVINPIVQRETRNNSSRYSKSRAESPAGG